MLNMIQVSLFYLTVTATATWIRAEVETVLVPIFKSITSNIDINQISLHLLDKIFGNLILKLHLVTSLLKQRLWNETLLVRIKCLQLFKEFNDCVNVVKFVAVAEIGRRQTQDWRIVNTVGVFVF